MKITKKMKLLALKELYGYDAIVGEMALNKLTNRDEDEIKEFYDDLLGKYAKSEVRRMEKQTE